MNGRLAWVILMAALVALPAVGAESGATFTTRSAGCKTGPIVNGIPVLAPCPVASQTATVSVVCGEEACRITWDVSARGDYLAPVGPHVIDTSLSHAPFGIGDFALCHRQNSLTNIAWSLTCPTSLPTTLAVPTGTCKHVYLTTLVSDEQLLIALASMKALICNDGAGGNVLLSAA